MDSKRDRDTVIALLERLTSVNFVAKKLRQIQSKRGVQGCRDSLKENLNRLLNRCCDWANWICSDVASCSGFRPVLR